MARTASLSLAHKIDILIHWNARQQGTTISEADIADGSELAYRTVHGLRKGELDNPQLSTLQALCKYFRISLSYFDCQTKSECEAYLANKVEDDSLSEVARQAEGISPEGLQSILQMIKFVRRAQGLPDSAED